MKNAKSDNHSIKKCTLMEVFLLICWTVYFVTFFSFYKDALGFAEGENSILIKIVMIFKYRQTQLLLFLAAFFFLVALNFLLILFIYDTRKNNQTKQNTMTIRLISLAFILCILGSITNVLSIPFIISGGISLTISYICFLIFRYQTNKKEDLRGHYGPFDTFEDASSYFSNTLDTKELLLNHTIYTEDEDGKKQYFIEISNQSQNEVK
ncbi:hypothetical protein ACWOAH_09655 [Vagococcus vulneris]|uniref:Uncharacterized protein n=1 Tax=Vagococcus vulneris TaxID=1977869 RepID=A0A429ZU06_9ENTE|nr:hypothetical protein [Vagococcus vulneris]RST97153.1 hypothetical protein CBF37_10250 [Vagococcus vulneris]